jgi:hypothetical protein
MVPLNWAAANLTQLIELTSAGQVEPGDHQKRRLLSPRSERPSGYIAAEKNDKFPQPHAFFPGQGPQI